MLADYIETCVFSSLFFFRKSIKRKENYVPAQTKITFYNTVEVRMSANMTANAMLDRELRNCVF